MALQVRRGTNAERLGITPAEGELIYTIDTKQLYVGDGTTAGGNASIAGTIDSLLADATPQLGGTLDLNNNDITGTGNINITGTITASGTVNLGDGVGSDILVIGGAIQGHMVPDTDKTHNLGSLTKNWNEAFIGQLIVDSQITAERIQADIIADDSTVVFNASTGLISAAQVSGTFTGNVIGNAAGAHTGTFDGDMTGSVFGDDSTVLVDGVNNTINGTSVFANILQTNDIQDKDTSGILTVNLNNTGGNNQPRIILESNGSAGSGLWITTNDTTRTLAGTDNIGRILFRSIDQSGTETPVVAIARKDEFIIAVGSKGTPETMHINVGTGNYGFGIEPSAVAKVNVGGAMLLGNMDTTARDALVAANGMIIYNTTDNKFQGYENGSWANLI